MSKPNATLWYTEWVEKTSQIRDLAEKVSGLFPSSFTHRVELEPEASAALPLLKKIKDLCTELEVE